MKKLKSVTRMLVAVSALLMVITFFVPIWQILMWAPQYPEGLEMKIWLYTLSGDYKIISGLNHYIGMKHIEVEMFPEFKYMIYVVGFLVVFGLITVFANKRFMVFAYLGLILFAGVAGMVDFYQWGYDYGHNLDPTAPIVVPGMAYQPPLIGTKQLLNFTAFSGPDIGGWMFVLAGVLAIGAIVLEHTSSKKKRKHKQPVIAALVSVLIITLVSCSVKPEPLAYGKDGCYHCKMTLMDHKFGCEVVTTKGKIFKFDDVNCLNNFLISDEVPSADIAQILVVNFMEPGKFINAEQALFVTDKEIKSPMGSMTAAFSTVDEIKSANPDWKSKVTAWEEAKSIHY
jgi:copper chaperone NosL